MIKETRFYSAYNLADFKKYMVSTLPYNASSATTNEWTFNEATGVAKVATDTNTAGYIDLRIGKLYVGDVIEVSAYLRNLSGGNNPAISIDFSSTNSFTGSNFSNQDYLRTDDSDTFTLMKYKFIVKKDGFYRIAVGKFTSDIGDFEMMRTSVKVSSGAKANTEFGSDVIVPDSSKDLARALKLTDTVNMRKVLKWDRAVGGTSIPISIDMARGSCHIRAVALYNAGVGGGNYTAAYREDTIVLYRSDNSNKNAVTNGNTGGLNDVNASSLTIAVTNISPGIFEIKYDISSAVTKDFDVLMVQLDINYVAN